MSSGVEKEARKLSIEMRSLEENAEALQSRLNMVDAAMDDLTSAKETLKGLKENTGDSQLLVPIGGNSYIKAQLDDSDKVIVGMGAGVSVEKTFKEAKEVIGKRKENLKETKQTLQKRFEKVAQKINQKKAKIQQLAGDLREGKTSRNV